MERICRVARVGRFMARTADSGPGRRMVGNSQEITRRDQQTVNSDTKGSSMGTIHIGRIWPAGRSMFTKKDRTTRTGYVNDVDVTADLHG